MERVEQYLRDVVAGDIYVDHTTRVLADIAISLREMSENFSILNELIGNLKQRL